VGSDLPRAFFRMRVNEMAKYRAKFERDLLFKTFTELQLVRYGIEHMPQNRYHAEFFEDKAIRLEACSEDDLEDYELTDPQKVRLWLAYLECPELKNVFEDLGQNLSVAQTAQTPPKILFEEEHKNNGKAGAAIQVLIHRLENWKRYNDDFNAEMLRKLNKLGSKL